MKNLIHAKPDPLEVPEASTETEKNDTVNEDPEASSVQIKRASFPLELIRKYGFAFEGKKVLIG